MLLNYANRRGLCCLMSLVILIAGAIVFPISATAKNSAVKGDKAEVKTGVSAITKKAVTPTGHASGKIKKTPTPGGPVATPYPN
jgi:hypothetical protein